MTNDKQVIHEATVKLFEKLRKESGDFFDLPRNKNLNEWHAGQIMLDVAVNFLCCMIETYATDQGKEKITGDVINHLFSKYVAKENSTQNLVN